MFRFIHAADIHLDSPLRGLERYEGAPLEEIRGASRRAFDKLIDLAINEKVAFVLLVGDLYDGDWKDYNTGLYFVQCMQRLQQAGIRVFAIHGNHDAASVLSKSLRVPDNVHFLATRKAECILLEDLGVAICGQGFATRAVTQDLTADYPEKDPRYFTIGLLHTCLDGKPGHEPYAPCSIDGLRVKGYDYWALGHVHTREIISQDPWIVFPGNIQGRHIRETGAKGCTLVQVENGKVQQVEHRAVDVMRWALCVVDVAGCETVDAVHEKIAPALEQAQANADGMMLAVRLELKGTCAAHERLMAEEEYWIQEYRSLAAGLRGAGVWLERVIFRTAAIADVQETTHRLRGLLQGIDTLQLDEEILNEFRAPLTALRNKLPPDIQTGELGYDPLSEETIRKALHDVKGLLMQRLLSTDVP